MSLDRNTFVLIEDRDSDTRGVLEQVCVLYNIEYPGHYVLKLDKYQFFATDYSVWNDHDMFHKICRQPDLWVVLDVVDIGSQIRATNDPEVIRLLQQLPGKMRVYPVALLPALVRYHDDRDCWDLPGSIEHIVVSKDAFIAHHVRKLPLGKELEDMFDSLCKNYGIPHERTKVADRSGSNGFKSNVFGNNKITSNSS